MNDEKFSFGNFVKRRRENLGKTQKGLAEEVKISPAYLSDIENGNRRAPEMRLEQFAKALKITEKEDIEEFYDLAGVSQRGQHFDINKYMRDKPNARKAFRAAIEDGWTDDDWCKLIEKIKRKNDIQL